MPQKFYLNELKTQPCPACVGAMERVSDKFYGYKCGLKVPAIADRDAYQHYMGS